MPPEPKSNSQKDTSKRNSLPFEPKKNRKPAEKKTDVPKPPSAVKSDGKSSSASRQSNQAIAIPDSVSRRMVQRMALFSGIPTFLGMSTFVVSYLLITQDLAQLPNSVVVLVSVGFFGLGVLGLSYGVLSASWEEDTPGSRLGWSEFVTNFKRMTSAWRSTNKE